MCPTVLLNLLNCWIDFCRCSSSWCSCIARRPSSSIAAIRNWSRPSFYFTRRSSSCSSPTFTGPLTAKESRRRNSRLNKTHEGTYERENLRSDERNTQYTRTHMSRRNVAPFYTSEFLCLMYRQMRDSSEQHTLENVNCQRSVREINI